MKINKIILDNFATYKKEELDFDKLGNIISMYGSTGAGKTTLIVDALTFCLFSRAYGVEKAESLKYVIPVNSNKAKAELIFTVNDRKFKIIREVYKDQPSIAVLEEFKDGSWKKITASVKVVEEFVKEKLGLDYKTFLNSIVIRQGEVVNLLESEPKERREILLKTFNLDFSKYLEKAKKIRDQIENEIDKLTSQAEIIKENIKKENEYKINLEKCIQGKQYVEESKKLLEYRKNTELIKLNLIQNKINELEKKIIEYEYYEKNYNELKDRLNKRKKEIEEIKELIKNKDNILKEKEEIEKKINEFNNLLNLQHQYNLKYNEKRNLLKELQRLEKEMREIEEANKKYINLKNLKSKIAELENKYSSLIFNREEKIKEKVFSETLIQQLNNYLNVIKDSKEGICPVCKTKLNEDKILELKSHYTNEIVNLNNRLKELNKNIDIIEKEIDIIEKELEKLNKEIAEEKYLESIISNKNNVLSELNSKKEELLNIEKQINEITKFLNDYKNINIEYEKIKLEKLRDEKIKKITTIEHYESNLPNLIEEMNEMENEIKTLEEKLKYKPNIEEYNSLKNELENQRKIVEEIERNIAEYSRKIGEYEGIINSIIASLKEIEDKKLKLKEIENMINSKKKIKQVYEILCNDVFNERGFPLILLNNYLKDIELFMNDYLSKILPGKTVEIKHSEGKIEVIVRDDIYARELATYSGGEKTIIGFCLRLALAKAMALYRLGVIPKFLIVDEGFGPLSYEFRKAILNLFSYIKEDYEKIIIISHIEDIKENPIFDTFIEVYKDENNISHISIK